MSAQSVAELPDFPYPTFAEFQDAQAHGRALVWVRFDFGAAWALDKGGRFGNALLCGAGIWGAVACAVWAGAAHDWRLLWGVATCLIGAWFATPTPGCLSGGGCMANLLLFGGAFAAFKTHLWPLFAVGGVGCVCWALTSLGDMVVDGLLREAMMRSEETFLWLLARGTIVRVEAAPSPADPPPDETVWPPPPLRPRA